MSSTSILIPCFNAASFIEATLESVLNNMEKEDEVILVDDHSEDDSMGRAQRWLDGKGAKHTVALNPSKGACAARNHALALSKGDFIQWLDADDLLAKNKIARQKQHLRSNPSTVVVSPFRPFVGDPRTGIISDDREWPSSSDLSPSDWLASGQVTIPACWLGHRTVFENAGAWDTTLKVNQDGEYFARVLAAADAVQVEPGVEVYYRRGVAGSVSHFTAEKAESLYRSVESIHQTAISLEDSTRMRQMVANLYQHAIYTAYPHCPKGQKRAESQLERLPTPDIHNPNAISALSKTFTRVFGWKALTRARMLRHRLTA